MFCSNCGKQNPDNAKFCDGCGQPVASTAAPQYAPPRQQQYTPPPQPQYAPPPPPQYAPPQPPVYPQPQQSPFAPNAAPPYTAAEAGVSPKSRTTAGLLCFFLGWAGAHRFYAGKSGTGALILVLFILGWILTVALGILGYIILSPLGLWIFIDFIMILMGKFKDKNGFYIKN
jgi:TM2 domain-containing membrane protein YozV